MRGSKAALVPFRASRLQAPMGMTRGTDERKSSQRCFWPLNTALYVRDFKGNDPRFVAALLTSLELGQNDGAAAVPGLNRNHLHQLPVRVPDVAAQDNYIACSFTVKSEIVVPLFVNGQNIGQIDIDSNVLDPFTEADERFLEFVNEQIAKLY